MKKCSCCKVDKEQMDFPQGSWYCKKCHNEKTKRWRQENKGRNALSQKKWLKTEAGKRSKRSQVKAYYLKNCKQIIKQNRMNEKEMLRKARNKILDYLLGHPCVDCGQKNPLRLTFDHVRGIKVFSIGNAVGGRYGWDRIQKEMQKCDVRCFNCHMEKTAIERNFMMYQLLKERNLFGFKLEE